MVPQPLDQRFETASDRRARWNLGKGTVAEVDVEQGTALLWLEKEQLYELAVALERMLEREAREVRGDAPVPPSWPAMVMMSA